MSRARVRPPSRRILSARRALISLGVGVLVGAVVALLGAPELWPVVAWSVAATVVLTWVWRISWPHDAYGTERLAEEESRSRSTDAGVLIAAVVSLCAVVLALVLSSNQQDAVGTAAVVLSIVAVILSWCVVNSVFALKYARLYYVDEDGGIDFKQEEPPAYSDFAYLRVHGRHGLRGRGDRTRRHGSPQGRVRATRCCRTSSAPECSPSRSTSSPASGSRERARAALGRRSLG